MGSESYVGVSGLLLRVNPNSFILETEDGEEHIIGRSCVHGADESRIAAATPGAEVELRIFEWLARREGME